MAEIPLRSTDDRSSIAVRCRSLSLWYGTFQALMDVDLDVKRGIITSLIGPSGCGKSTLLRCVNRINERLGYVRTEGLVEVLGHDAYDPQVDLSQLRRQVGMVFQRPNPLPISIRDNILFGQRMHEPDSPDLAGSAADDVVESALREVLLWDGVKDHLDRAATSLSLEEQQKLCIARLLPLKPSLILMDEPCSALDPKATAVIEDLIWKLRGDYTIILVTHNMAQARRASDECAFMLMGRMIEHRKTDDLFVTPKDQRTADYIEGRYG